MREEMLCRLQALRTSVASREGSHTSTHDLAINQLNAAKSDDEVVNLLKRVNETYKNIEMRDGLTDEEMEHVNALKGMGC